MCSDGGGVNHPCPWPLAALISSERWSRTRSISNAAGNDTSPASPGRWPRMARHSPSITASYCILPPHFLLLARQLSSKGKNMSERKALYFPFYSLVQKSSRKRAEAERQRCDFYLGSHPLALSWGIIIPNLFIFVCLSLFLSSSHTHSCIQLRTEEHTRTVKVRQILKLLMRIKVLIKKNTHWQFRRTIACRSNTRKKNIHSQQLSKKGSHKVLCPHSYFM